jgi:hypothetical protein
VQYFRRLVARGSVVGWGTIPRGFKQDEVIKFFNWPNPSSRTMALRSTQPLTEMSTRNLPLEVKGGRRIRLTNLQPSVSRLCRENVGASNSHNPMGLYGLLQGWLYLSAFCFEDLLATLMSLLCNALHLRGMITCWIFSMFLLNYPNYTTSNNLNRLMPAISAFSPSKLKSSDQTRNRRLSFNPNSFWLSSTVLVTYLKLRIQAVLTSQRYQLPPVQKTGPVYSGM